MILEDFLSANHWDEKLSMRDDIRSSLSVDKKNIDMNSNEEIGNCLEIEVDIIKKELKMEIYQEI
jgi:hypothetical protein